MSISTESANSSGHGPLVSRLSHVSMVDNIAATPFARPRKLSRNLSTVSSAGIGLLGSPTSPPETTYGVPAFRKLQRSSTGPAPLIRKSSQLQIAATKGTGQSAAKMGSGSGGTMTSPSDTVVGGRSTLPALTESRRMNLTDVVIWRRFTRALKQRVEDRKTERRTFCWLDRSMSSYEGRRRQAAMIEYEPSYRMEPTTKMSETDCRKLLDDYLQEKLKNVQYDAEKCGLLSKRMSNEIRQRVKSSGLLPPRYKCVAYVVLGEKNDQGVRVSSMSAWDKDTDNFVSVNFQNGSVFCVVTLFAIYFE